MQEIIETSQGTKRAFGPVPDKQEPLAGYQGRH
jgi:hypothetical protein